MPPVSPARPIYLHEYHFDGTLMRTADTIAGAESYADGRIARIEVDRH